MLDDVSRRPWPPPERPWSQAQTWVDVGFVHWRVDHDELQRHVPESVELQTFDGSAWLGVVPFLLTALRVRGLPPLPRVSTFTELNVRTCVTHDGRPGVWFFSLDASSRLAVEAAKRVYKLPYVHAEMRYERDGDRVHYESARPGAAFTGSYHGRDKLFHAAPGSLEEFLVERYCFYTEDGGRLYRGEVHHPPWDLQRGVARVDLNTMAPLPLPAGEPHVLYSPRQDVVVWSLDELAA